jgi:hypothetical protein
MIQPQDMPDFMNRFSFFEVHGGKSEDGEHSALEIACEAEDKIHILGVEVLRDYPER